jgi:hypothetical protein
MNIKQLTDKQREYIETILRLIRQEVDLPDNVDPWISFDEYSYIEFTDGETEEVEVYVLREVLKRGEYNDIVGDYLNNRKDKLKRLVSGEPFTFNIQPTKREIPRILYS